MLIKIVMFLFTICVTGIIHYMDIYVLERTKNSTLHFIFDAIFLILSFYLIFIRNGGFMAY